MYTWTRARVPVSRHSVVFEIFTCRRFYDGPSGQRSKRATYKTRVLTLVQSGPQHLLYGRGRCNNAIISLLSRRARVLTRVYTIYAFKLKTVEKKKSRFLHVTEILDRLPLKIVRFRNFSGKKKNTRFLFLVVVAPPLRPRTRPTRFNFYSPNKWQKSVNS